jgi:hypothetical protein
MGIKKSEIGRAAAIAVKDEGSPVVSALAGMNFAGAGVTATESAPGQALVTIPGGSSLLLDLTPAVATPTGEIWNGKPVYRKNWAGSSLAASTPIDGTDEIVRVFGWAGTVVFGTGPIPVTGGANECSVARDALGSTVIWATGGYVGGIYSITVEYTIP